MVTASSTDIAEKIDANFAQTCFLGSGINSATVKEDSFVTHFVSPYMVPWMNLVLKTDGNAPNLRARIEDVLAQYDNPMTWRLGAMTSNVDAVAAELDSLGLMRSSWVEPGMCLNMEYYKRSEPHQDLLIEEVTHEQQVNDWLIPFSQGFSVPVEVSDHFRKYGNERLAGSEGEKWFVGYSDGRVASCAQYLSACGINMIYSICTVSQFRSKGFARRMVDHVIADSLAYADLPVGLFASEMGLPLYEKMGFVTQFRRTDYIYTPPY